MGNLKKKLPQSYKILAISSVLYSVASSMFFVLSFAVLNHALMTYRVYRVLYISAECLLFVLRFGLQNYGNQVLSGKPSIVILSDLSSLCEMCFVTNLLQGEYTTKPSDFSSCTKTTYCVLRREKPMLTRRFFTMYHTTRHLYLPV